jgi:hypothetical protein
MSSSGTGTGTGTGTIRRKIIKRPIATQTQTQTEPIKETEPEKDKDIKIMIEPEPIRPEDTVIIRRVYAIASEILGDSFRPQENNLTVGKIVVPPELLAKWKS